MLNIEKAEKILEMVLEEYPSLYTLNIEIKNSNKFYLETKGVFNDSIIYIGKINYQDKFTKWLNKYLNNEYQLNSSFHMYNSFNDVFAFLHEIGHIYYFDIFTEEEKEKEYKQYKEKKYNKYEEAWKEYRLIKNEQLADSFASNFMNENILKIWSIMEDISIEKAQEEYEFWSAWV